MMEVAIRNRQRSRRIDVRRLREIAEFLVGKELQLETAALGIHLIGAGRMAEMNRRWLGHIGSTDILTFDHRDAIEEGATPKIPNHFESGEGLEHRREDAGMAWRGESRLSTPDSHLPSSRRERAGKALEGECFISIDDAVRQAREFGTTPALELVRYVVHGVLHLLGYDDIEAGKRRAMKRAEDRLVRRLAGRFSLRGLVKRAGS